MNINGFKASAFQAGMKYKNRLDVGLIAADGPVSAAGVYTKNLVCAAPVLWSKEKTSMGKAAAILVNAGQANACTGSEGMENARRSAAMVSQTIKCDVNHVLLCSTGVIGQQMNMTALEQAVPRLTAELAEDNLDIVARAMMTTDTVPKTSEREGLINGKPFKIAGMAKGSGMIAPNMATMLSFVLTDASISPEFLQEILSRTTETTFNTVTVDSDTSTNDTVLALASGKAGNAMLTSSGDQGAEEFENAFHAVMYDLAKMIARDGEGATKLVHVKVDGGVDDAQARLAAMAVANSPLVKTAIFGEDANWGRIMMALGKSGASFDQEKVNVFVDDVALVKDGMDAGVEDQATSVMKKKEFDISINLCAGDGRATVMTCDLSMDYIKINADYRS